MCHSGLGIGLNRVRAPAGAISRNNTPNQGGVRSYVVKSTMAEKSFFLFLQILFSV